MKRTWNSQNNDHKNKKKYLIIMFTSIILIVMIAISFILIPKQFTNQSSLTNVEQADESESVITDEIESLVTDENNSLQEDATDKKSLDGTLEDIETEEIDDLINDSVSDTVDVLPVDDGDDPQQEGTTGVDMDISSTTVQENETDVMSYGIDVAKWQGVIDWGEVKASGIEFAMIRIGYRTQVSGEIYEDPYAKYNLQQAQANDIKIGVYFFSTAVTKQEAKEEAAWVASYIAPYPITYPVAYNCEGFTNADNRQYGISNEQRTDIAIAFLNHIVEQGYTPMFYASKNELEQNAQWETDLLSEKFMIWVAQYPNEFYTDNSKSSYSGKHAMWQYTSKGSVPGISHAVDINIAYFRYDKTAKAKDNTPQKEVSADPTALVHFTETNDIVTAKIETNLRTVPSTADTDTIASVLKNGETVLRTGIGNNGWSRVEYNGENLYAVTSYLTTDLDYLKNNTPTLDNPEAGIIFTEVNEFITAKEKTNLRLIPSTESDDTIVSTLYNGETATRTGIGDNGWSRVEYKGQTLYAVSNYIMVVEQ